MRLLLVSDLHYVLRQFDWVLDRASEFDVVVLAGDLLDISSLVPLETQVVAMQATIRALTERCTTIVCSGNHDLTARNVHGEKSAPWIEAMGTNGAFVDWMTLDGDDLRITICPWWDGPATRADVAEQLAGDRPDDGRRWMWIYHYPPDDSPVSWVGNRHIGDRDLTGWIAEHRPDVVLTGHIHDAPFRDGGSWSATMGTTTVINAGRHTGPIPAHVEIDSVENRATWWSAYGTGDGALWSPGSGPPS